METKQVFIVHTIDDLIKPIKDLIFNLGKQLDQKGAIIFLNGNLAAGKTAFVQEFGYFVGITKNIQSPTFTLMKSYDVDSFEIPELYKIVHVDAYRLEPHHKESLNIEDFLEEAGTLVFVEWPTAIDLDSSISFANIDFEVVDEKMRKITIRYKTKDGN